MATTADAAAFQAIYAPSVLGRDVATSFEIEVPTVDEMAARITAKTRTYPWLTVEEDGRVIGYAYADPHRSRAAYQWCAEVSAYVDARSHRTGVGRALYQALFDLLRRQGVINVYAGITLPNPGSVGLHESLGFQLVGVYRAIGFKYGKAHDVGWWHLALGSWPSHPAPITPIAGIDLPVAPDAT